MVSPWFEVAKLGVGEHIDTITEETLNLGVFSWIINKLIDFDTIKSPARG
jgi:hypothetical protein